VSPADDNTYDLSEIPPKLIYKVDEVNNYSITVFLGSDSLGFKSNNSILMEITTSGSYSLRVAATDVAENIGSVIVEFTVRGPESSKTSEASNWFSSSFTILFLIFLTLISRKKN